MNFFKQIHESIVSPFFYRKIISFSGMKVLWYVVRLIILTALVEGAVHTWQAFDTETGLPYLFSRVLQGVSLRNGELVSETDDLYTPPGNYVRDLVAFLGAVPMEYVNVGDSSLVVDTRAQSRKGPNPNRNTIRLMRRRVEFSNGAGTIPIEYTDLFGDKGQIYFTSEEIESFLESNIVAVSFFFIISHMLKSGRDILFALFFLAIAAYIFRNGRRDLVYSVKIASFAISSIAVANILEALSMTSMAWTGQAALIISSVVLFRAIRATGVNPDEVSANNSGE
ncbi:MAG: DUF1189 family protein [Fibrobacterota bacterium]